MARLKNNSFLTKTTTKVPLLMADTAQVNEPSAKAPRDPAARSVRPSTQGSLSQALNFGSMHTKSGSIAGSAGSQWTSLLNSASGGASSVIGGGLLSVSGLGFISKLFGLFSGTKTPPAAPTQFVSPVAQHESLSITIPSAASSVSINAPSLAGTNGGAYTHSGSLAVDHAAQSAQVIQIVKRALLTSSSLNDVISEI